nr:hypothetical protein [Nocardia tengchongensis]
MDSGVVEGSSDEGHVHRVVAQPRARVVVAELALLHRDSRMALLEGGENRIGECQRRTLERAEDQAVTLPALNAAGPVDRRVHTVERALDIGQECRTGHGQFDSACRPREQHQIQRALQLFDLHAQTLLRNAEPARRARKTQLFGDRDEVTQLACMHLHGPILTIEHRVAFTDCSCQ